jgi:N-acyl-D-aspartate/D-glutamate deacylase
MAAKYDVVIRNGLVVDGTGAEPYAADVAVKDGLIVEVGQVKGKGAEEIDAKGLLVTPGFVDLHTHYDGQAIWSKRLNPSSQHGVTTILMGNCGVGFAPCKPKDRDLLIACMEGVEDIPGVVMREGLTWDWETFPEYLDAIDRSERDIDVAVLAPHSPIRVYVMGERGANREPATDDDLAKMSAIIRDAVKAGAVGFGSSRVAIDRRSDGALIPSFDADEREIIAAGQAVKDAGGVVLQIIPENGMTGMTPEQEFSLMRNVSKATGIPITYSHIEGSPDRVRSLYMLNAANEHNASGAAPIHPQYFPRPAGMIAGLDLTSNPFVHCPSYKAIAHLPLAERVAEMRKPEVKEKIINEKPDAALLPLTALTRMFNRMYPLSNPPNYEPPMESNIQVRAEREGRTPEDIAYDLLLEDDGKALLLVAIANYGNATLDYMPDYFDNAHTVMGLGDGGAHYGLICDSSYPTFVLSHWARDRKNGQISLAQAVKAMARTPAEVIGLKDRGLIAPGYKADINVIDHKALTLYAPEIVDDLPGGGRRLDQRATGYRYTLVNGVTIAKDDAPTGKTPGRLVRGAQSPALAQAAE